jgi:outer membrane biosynthesis protein TonB
MFTRLLLPLLVTALLAAQAPAQHPESRTLRRATAGKSKIKTKSPAQLAAEFTPKVKAALAARWADALTPHLNEFAAGYLKVTFKLDAEGKVANFAVTANSSDEPFAKFCEQFVRETAFEKPPSGALKEGLLEIPFTFTIL